MATPTTGQDELTIPITGDADSGFIAGAMLRAPTAQWHDTARNAYVSRKGVGYLESELTVQHSLGQELVRPDLYTETQSDPTWELSQEDWKDGQWKNLEPLSRGLADGSINSRASYRQALARAQHYQRMIETTHTHSFMGRLGAGIPLQLLDPINAPEMIAASMTGGLSALARIGIGGALSAGTAYAQESVIQDRAYHQDEEMKRNVALFAGVLGGAAYGLFGKSGVRQDVDYPNPALRDGDNNPVPASARTVVGEGERVEIGESGKFFTSVKDKDGNTTYVVKDIGDAPERTHWGFRSIFGRMSASKSSLVRGLADLLSVSGISKSKGVQDRADYVKAQIHGIGTRAIESIRQEHRTLQNGMDELEFMEAVYAHTVAKRGLHETEPPQEFAKSVGYFSDWIKAHGEHMEASGNTTYKEFDANRSFDIDTIKKMPKEDVITMLKDALSGGKGRQGTDAVDKSSSKVSKLNDDLEVLRAKLAEAESKGKGTKTVRDKIQSKLNALAKAKASRDKVFAEHKAAFEAEHKEIVTELGALKKEVENEVELALKTEDKQALKELDQAIAKATGVKASQATSIRAKLIKAIKAQDKVDIPTALATALSGVKGIDSSVVGKALKDSAYGLGLVRKNIERITTRSTRKKASVESKLNSLKEYTTLVSRLKEARRLHKNVTDRQGADGGFKTSHQEAEEIYATLTGDTGRESQFTLRRSRDMDTGKILPLLHKDLRAIILNVQRYQSGRLATKRTIGVETDGELSEMLNIMRPRVVKELEDAGMSRAQAKIKANAELELAKKSVKHVWNTQMTPSNPNGIGHKFKVFVQNMNFATLGGGIWATALQSELSTVIARGSLNVALRSMGMSFKQMKNLIQSLPPDTAFARQLQLMSFAFDVSNHSTASRFIDGEDILEGADVASKAGRTSQRAAELVAKGTGLTSITASFRMAIANTLIVDLFFNPKLVKGMSKRDTKAWTRLQVDVDKIAQLQSMKDDVFVLNKNGSIKEMDLTKLDPEMANMVERMVFNASKLDILSGDKMHLPEIWSNPDSVHYMFTQFLAYPVQAYESLLARGVSEGNARTIVGVTFSAAVSTMLAMTKEEVEVKAGWKDPNERKYEWNDEGVKNAFINATNKGAMSAPLSLSINMLSQGLTGGRLGSEWSQSHFMGAFGGAPVGKIQDIYKSLKTFGMDVHDGNSDMYHTVYGRTLLLNTFTPIYSLPMVGEWLRHENKQLELP